MLDALQCTESLVKISNKFNHISVIYFQKIAQKQPKIVLSACMKLFETSKLENYLINFKTSLWFIQDLGLVLFDGHKDEVSGKNLCFWQYFEGKLSSKMDQNHQFCVFVVSALTLNSKWLFRDCLCLMKDVLLVEISANSSHICRRKSPETSQRGLFHGCCIATKTFKNL